MGGIDWRKLYAQNQAAIAAARTCPPARTFSELPKRALASSEHDWPHHPPLIGRRALGNPNRHQPAATSRPRHGPHVDDGVLVHIPADLDPSVPVAAVCMLHGCTQG